MGVVVASVMNPPGNTEPQVRKKEKVAKHILLQAAKAVIQWQVEKSRKNVRNQVDFKRPPEEVFHNPAADGGIHFLQEPAFIWRPHPPATIKGIPISQHAEINARLSQFVETAHRHKTFGQVAEFNTSPVLLDAPLFKKSYATINGKCLLGGAAGNRILNRYVWENETQGQDPEKALSDYFLNCQRSNRDAVLPLMDLPHDHSIPFAIECRNTFNYFHFLTETLCQLCLAVEVKHEGPIFLHFPNQIDKTRDFTRKYIQAFFPEIADRVIFQRTPFQHERAYGVYNFMTSYFMFPESSFGSVDAFAPSGVVWKKRHHTSTTRDVLGMNSFDHSLGLLRKRALSMIDGKDFSHLPRRFWVTRDPDLARKRPMRGEAQILEMLTLFGFESVVFEHLSPLEQVALMANAEMMVSYHGAGFTNMLFANPKAWVIEIGNAQTAEIRWGHFWPLAHVSGCRYISFFADFDNDNEVDLPDFKQVGLVPVSLSKKGLAQIMSFIVSALGMVPQLTRKDDILALVEQMTLVGAPEKALAVFVKHPGVEKGDASLLLAKAEAFRALGHEHDRFILLHSAYASDPTRWNLLIQIIWSARTLNNTDAMRTALAVLKDGFPERFEAFVRERPWFRAHVA